MTIAMFLICMLLAFSIGGFVGLLGHGMAMAARKRALDDREAELTAREFLTYVAPAKSGGSIVKPRPFAGHRETDATIDELDAAAVDESPASPVAVYRTKLGEAVAATRDYVKGWVGREHTDTFEAIRPPRSERDRSAAVPAAAIIAHLRAAREHVDTTIGGTTQ